jgi:ComF family protein
LAREILAPVVGLIYPVYCGGCGRRGESFCSSCTDTLIAIDEGVVCPLCGKPVGSAVVCGACIVEKRHFDRACFGFSYEGPMREALHAFKFQARKDVGRTLVRLLTGKIESFARDFDVIVPLPVTEKRLKARGFNQSFVISEEISEIAGKPIDYSTLVKIRETLDQHSLSKKERKKNVAGAFALKGAAGRLEGKRLLLVDDLFTTGNTASEAARTLKRARPESILSFSLARTPE